MGVMSRRCCPAHRGRERGALRLGRRATEPATERAQLSLGSRGGRPGHSCRNGSGPAPSSESLLRPAALCLGLKLALSAAPERAGCVSQVRAAVSALRPRHRAAGRARSSWLGKGEGRGPR